MAKKFSSVCNSIAFSKFIAPNSPGPYVIDVSPKSSHLDTNSDKSSRMKEGPKCCMLIWNFHQRAVAYAVFLYF